MSYCPPEIWKAIFHFSAPDIQERLHPSKPPIVLTHVCRCWRDIALSTPTLWTTLNLPCFTFPADVMASFRAHLITMLSASSPLPLTFAIDASNSCTSENYSLALECVEILCRESHRWRVAFMNSHVLARLPDHLPVSSLPLLEHIGVTGTSPVNIGYTHHSLALLQSAPRLISTECHDHGALRGGVLHPSFLSLPHITHYSAGGDVRLCMDQLFPYILRCSNVVSLDLWFPQVWDIDSSHHWRMSSPASVLLPRLRSLSAKFATVGVLIAVISPLSLPSITSLALATALLNARSNSLRLVFDFVLKCHTTLEELCLPFRWLSRLDDYGHLGAIRSLIVSDIVWGSAVSEWLRGLVLRLSNFEGSGWVMGKYGSLRCLSLRTVHGRSFRTEEREFLASTFATRSNVLTDIIDSRLGRQPPFLFETFSIDYASLLAMQDCASNCSDFLHDRWCNGLGGRPLPTPSWVQRDLPVTWSGLSTAPRFVKDEGYEEEESDEEG